MLNSLPRAGKLSVCCLLAATAGLGIWTSQRGQATAASGSQSLLANIPAALGDAPSERELTKWASKARQEPGNAGAWANLGDAMMQRARETQDSSYYGSAEKVYAEALRLQPKHAGATTGMAWVCSSRHEFEQSMEWARRALALTPGNQDAYGLLGDAQVELGDYDAAMTSYQKMLDLRPDLSSYSRGAHLLFLNGNYRKGMWLMAKAVEAGAPYGENTAWCRAQLALMLFNTGALRPAEQVLKQGLKVTPRNAALLAAMGRVKAAQKDYPAAISYYQQSVAVVPLHDSLVALGDLYGLTGKKAEAEQQFALVEATHRLNQARGVRGDMQIAQFYANHDRKLPEALKDAQEEYRTRKNVFAADTLAWCLYKNGRLREAHEMAAGALRLKTPEASFLFHAGMIEAKLGNRVAAQNYLYRATSLNPNFSPVYARAATDELQRLGAKPLQTTASATP